MTAGSIVPTLPVPLLRDGLGREAASLSLRGVAREVGMSPNGVRDFLQGAIPRSATRVKLERWLATRGKVTRPPRSEERRIGKESRCRGGGGWCREGGDGRDRGPLGSCARGTAAEGGTG